jgi:hypothetical protein
MKKITLKKFYDEIKVVMVRHQVGITKGEMLMVRFELMDSYEKTEVSFGICISGKDKKKVFVSESNIEMALKELDLEFLRLKDDKILPADLLIINQ